jgi:small-conductance mechanosensitive channel
MLTRCFCFLVLAALPLPAQQANAPLVTDDQILHHLNTVITWYRNIKTQVEPAGLPTDALYQANAESIAAQVVTHAFESAEKAAPLIPNESNEAASPTSRQQLLKFLDDTKARNAGLQKQISQLNDQITSASKRNAQALTDQRDRLQGELDLGQAMLNALTQLTQTTNQVSTNPKNQKGKPSSSKNDQATPNGFAASVAQLKNSVPEVFNANTKTSAPASVPQTISSNGLIGQLRRLYDQSLTLHELDTLTDETAKLEELVNNMRVPLRNTMKATVQQGRTLSATADNPQPGQAAPTKQDFDNLAAKFNQLAAVEIPLSQESSALEESKANLMDWRASIASQYGSILRSIFITVAIIVGVLGILLLVSNLWKRAIFRYVTDVRRRRQFLVVRRFVIGFLIALVLVFSVISEFSSLATFAGFITAGLAVGLQTVLLCVAAYFFLIGRYGIRVGDRISIAGVTGDVIDVGFVRFYLLELAGTGAELHPTGRIVAFANSVLFQATSPMFRQVPGTAYTWHEVAVSLQPSGNYELVESNMLEVVNKAYKKYQDTLDRQHGSIERRFELPLTPLKPTAQLQLTSTGLEAVVRYPVSLRHGAEADDEITRDLIEKISKDEAMSASVNGLPRIRSVIRS